MNYLTYIPTGEPTIRGKYTPYQQPSPEGIYNPAISGFLGRGEGTKIIGKFLSNIIGVMMIVGFIICLIYLIMGAYSWMTSGGDKAAVEQARLRISYAITGLVILASVWGIMLLIQYFFGITIIGSPGIRLPVPGS